MGEDASLDDFLDAADDAGTGSAERSEDAVTGQESDVQDAVAGETGADIEHGEDDDETAERVPSSGTAATYDWTPGGAACAACDSVVERRWRDDPGFVCEECKDW